MSTPQQPERLWTRDFILLMLVSTLGMTAITTQMGTLPLYVASLGGSTTASGAVVGILGISALLCRFPIGIMLDRYGRRIVIIIGLLILLVDFTLLNVFRTLFMLFCLRFIQGIGNGIQTTATSTLAADLIPPGRLSVGLGYFALASVVPSALGPLLGLTVVEYFGYNSLFLVGLALIAMALVLSLFLRTNTTRRRNSKTSKASSVPQSAPASTPEQATSNKASASSSRFLLTPAILIPSAVIFVVFCAGSGVTAFISQFAITRHISGSGWYFVAASAATVIVRLFILPMCVRFRQSSIVAVSLLIVVSTFIVVAFAKNLPMLLAAGALYGSGEAYLFPAMNTAVLQGVPENRRGRVTAFFSASSDVAYGGGALLWGMVANLGGFTIMFLACAACSALSIPLYAWLTKTVRRNSSVVGTTAAAPAMESE